MLGNKLEPAGGTIKPAGVIVKQDGLVFSVSLLKGVSSRSEFKKPLIAIKGKSLEPVTKLWYRLGIDKRIDFMRLGVRGRFLRLVRTTWSTGCHGSVATERKKKENISYNAAG